MYIVHLVVCVAAISTVTGGNVFDYPPSAVLDKIASRLPPGGLTFEDDVSYDNDVLCDVCHVTLTFLQLWIKMGFSQDEIVDQLTTLCKDMNATSDRICYYMPREYKDELFGVLSRVILEPHDACAWILRPTCGTPYNPDVFWNVTLPPTPKPPVVPPSPPAPTAPKIRMLHVTDIHIDLMYEEGSSAVCGEPICCRENDGKPAPGVAGAGKWGDNRLCDMPINFVTSFFKHLRTIQDQFDFVIFTGDIPAHDTWNQTRTQQTAATQRLTKLFLQYLPDKHVFFCVGNHESAPLNSYPPPEVTDHNSISWLYTVLAESWGNWLPAQSKDTILKGAYYTASPYPGFRVVSVNTNYCNIGNWWLLINRTDPADQLHWLIHVLQQAEDAKEKVIILTHFPPGLTNCLRPWSWNYYKIINRYESTVVGQFYGHTHKDTFEVFYDDVTFSRPVSVGYVMGSVTPKGELNPSYRIYTLDGNYPSSSWAVLDYETYYVNLTKANEGQEPPTWELEYEAKTEYNMTGLYPQDWSDLIYRMKQDDNLFQTFNRYTTRLQGHSTCTGECKKKLLCDLKSARSYDTSLCHDL